MIPFDLRTLIFLAACLFWACSASDSFLETQVLDISPIALAKPIVPGFNAPEVVAQAEQKTTDSKSILPPKSEGNTASNTENKNQITAPKQSPASTQSNPGQIDPARRLPSTTDTEPCNEVHKAMISSMQAEIDDLQKYYDDLTDIIERHNIMKEVREKKKDLQKYKRNHSCK